MKELSLNILDISQNSIKAEATVIYITIVENDETLTVTVEDDGFGMSPEMLENVTNPFCTSRTTRKVGLGIPFLKEAAEQTGGEFSITSKSREEFPDSHGTVTKASFFKKHLAADQYKQHSGNNTAVVINQMFRKTTADKTDQWH